MTGNPQHLAADQEYLTSMTFASSVTEVESLTKAASATVGGAYGPINAAVNASIESGLSTEETWSKESTQAKTVQLEKDNWYVFWELVDVMTFTFNSDFDSVLTIISSGHTSESKIPYKTGDVLSAATIVTVTYQDRLSDKDAEEILTR